MSRDTHPPLSGIGKRPASVVDSSHPQVVRFVVTGCSQFNDTLKVASPWDVSSHLAASRELP
jgi:hypothetical protein